MAGSSALAAQRLLSAMDYLVAFAKGDQSGVVADDVDLFCKLHAELLRRNIGSC